MILVWQKVKVILGIALCAIGIAGTLVPVIPGVPIILTGVALVGADHPLVRSLKRASEALAQKHKILANLK